MITPEQHAEIRRLYYGEHWKVGTIADAIGVHHDTVRAAIAAGADRKEAVAVAADSLAKRRVHAVGAAARTDWTRPTNRVTNRPDWLGRVGASR